MTDLLKRTGRVQVSREMIEHDPENIQSILGAILIVEARPRFLHNDVEYSGYSAHFDVQEDGNNIPLYEIAVETDGDDISIEFVKVD